MELTRKDYVKIIKESVSDYVGLGPGSVIMSYFAPINPSDEDIGMYGLYELIRDVDNSKCLEGAAKSGDIDILKRVALAVKDLYPAAEIALRNKNLEFVSCLIAEASLNTNYCLGRFSNLISGVIVFGSEIGCMDAIKMCLHVHHPFEELLGKYNERDLIRSLSTGVYYSSINGHIELSDYLLTLGADPIFDYRGSCGAKNIKRAKELLSVLESRETFEWEDRILSFIRAAEEGCLEMVIFTYNRYTSDILGEMIEEKYLKRDNYSEKPGGNMSIALAMAANNRHLDVVDWFLSNGVNLEDVISDIGRCCHEGAQDDQIRCPECLDNMGRDYQMLDYLISKGADPNCRTYSAVIDTDLDMIRYLLSKGIDRNQMMEYALTYRPSFAELLN